MSLTASEMTPADIAAVNGGNSWGNGFNGDGWWIILFLILAMGGNWGGNGFGGGNGIMPYIDTNNDIQRGFDQSAIMGGINGLTSAVSNGFATAEVARCNSDMNLMQTLNAMQMAQQNCCCDNRAGLADLKYTIATEACADRSAVSDGVRDIIASQTASTQAILDKLCQQEIDTLKTENANLQTQINLANLQASQVAQTSRILADNAAQTVALEQYLNPAPVPAYVVQNPNCCPTYNGCGCNL